MHPNLEGCTDLKCPVGGLLPVDGVLKEKEFLHQLDLPNADERKGLYVIKNTMATGVMIGCAMELLSVVQENHAYYGVKTSMEIAVHPYNHEDGAFSSPEDSGSIILDELGHIIVGLLTSGAGDAVDRDMTYLTPYFWLEEKIKATFPHSFLFRT